VILPPPALSRSQIATTVVLQTFDLASMNSKRSASLAATLVVVLQLAAVPTSFATSIMIGRSANPAVDIRTPSLAITVGYRSWVQLIVR
jgi:hypothetical protein